MATYRPETESNTLLADDSILEYVLETTVYPREHERLRELRLITQQHAKSFMRSSPDQMQFFSVLLKLIGASNTIEVGVFTGYSLLTAALALPAGGKVVAIDANREYYELGRPVIEKAGVAHKVDFREGDGIAELDEILSEDGGAMAAMPGSSEYDRLVRDSLVGFNAAVAADDRVEACIVPIADGVKLCRRVK
ncbi:caffeoyl-CoA O-methyltransferase [Hordeum vulgare]|nr:caffeoyl-CoA O-methyltransferase [Hordeum vulgare]